MIESIKVYVLDDDLRELIGFIGKCGGGTFAFAEDEAYDPLSESAEARCCFRITAVSRGGQAGAQPMRGSIDAEFTTLPDGTAGPMFFSIDRGDPDNDGAAAKLFTRLLLYVRRHFTASTDKSAYMGPNAFAEWQRKNFRTDGLFLYQTRQFKVDRTQFEQFLKRTETGGLFLLDNTLRITHNHKKVYEKEEYIIAEALEDVVHYFTAFDELKVESESECVYVTRELTGEKRTLVSIDARNQKEAEGKANTLFKAAVRFLRKVR